jgi:hypothetical protein
MTAIVGFILGAFSIFIMWTLARALRSGVIFSDGVGYDAHTQPRMFASVAAIHCSGAFLFAWLAANGGIARLWPLIVPVIGPHLGPH